MPYVTDEIVFYGPATGPRILKVEYDSSLGERFSWARLNRTYAPGGPFRPHEETTMIHARPDYNRIQDPDGLIPADMPVFLLLGKDRFAAATVRFWADQVERNGGDPHIVQLARAQALKMDELQMHKMPDLPA